VLLFSFRAEAKDLGKHGVTFPIIEQDLLETIQKKLLKMQKSGKIDLLNQKLREKTIAGVNRPRPVSNIGTTQIKRSWYFDPTITVGQDMKDHEGRIFHKAGSTVNPLRVLPLSKKLFFINGDDESQIQWFLRNRTPRDKLILVAGAPLKLMKKLQFRVYFDQKGFLTKKFKIENVPALIRQEGDLLLVEELPL
jgi:conjugal transfer pilus assembly protein TraW